MKREEEISQYLKERNIPITSLEANSIIEGIEWADNHPILNGKELLYVAQKTAERTKKEVIRKVCAYLEMRIDDYIIQDLLKTLEL
jgi:hypothetical protein